MDTIFSLKDLIGVSQVWTAVFGVVIAVFATCRLLWVRYAERREVDPDARNFLYGVILTWILIAALYIRMTLLRAYPEEADYLYTHWSVAVFIFTGTVAGIIHFRLFTRSFAREWGWIGLLVSTLLLCYAVYPTVPV
jgi:hypothetical protein